MPQFVDASWHQQLHLAPPLNRPGCCWAEVQRVKGGALGELVTVGLARTARMRWLQSAVEERDCRGSRSVGWGSYISLIRSRHESWEEKLLGDPILSFILQKGPFLLHWTLCSLHPHFIPNLSLSLSKKFKCYATITYIIIKMIKEIFMQYMVKLFFYGQYMVKLVPYIFNLQNKHEIF